MNFDDELDSLNDDGFVEYEPTPDDLAELNEWWDSRDPGWLEELDETDPDQYDLVDEADPLAEDVEDELTDSDWLDEADTPLGLEYDGYNDPEDY